MKMIQVFFALGFLSIVSCSTPYIDSGRQPAGVSSKYLLTSADIQKSMSAAIQVDGPTQLITDNIIAYQKRLDMIRHATRSIELAYYIYSNDESSSVVSKALLAAAQRGVKVRILVDYITNYKDLDLFLAMQEASKGNLEVRFYGRPTPNIIKDMIYATTACSEANNIKGQEAACVQEKKPIADKIDSLKGDLAFNYNSGFSGTLLSGIYTKSGGTIGYAVIEGAKFDPDSLKSPDGKPMTQEQKDDLLDLISLYRDVKFRNNIGAAIKLQLAVLMYGSDVTNLINTLDKLLPTGAKPYDENRMNDWEHITDYLHEKLLLVDNQEMILGGRNIENSYHMEKNPSGKYTFMDSDVYAYMTSDSGEGVQKSFNRLWNFKVMVATTKDILSHAPNDLQVALDTCTRETKVKNIKDPQLYKTTMAMCLGSAMQIPEDKRRHERFQKRLADMDKSAAIFNSQLNQDPMGRPVFDIDSDANIYYIENLDMDPKTGKRIYGAQAGLEQRGQIEGLGKGIHQIWEKGMLNACVSGKPATIYMHHAYFLPPAKLMSVLGEMTKIQLPIAGYTRDYEGLDCSKVTIKILTNSIYTTDLSIVNLYARHQMHEWFKALETRGSPKAAKVEYYEYKKGEKQSLHTKITLMGEDIIVGSANADVRSYAMDANNGVLIRNAPKLIQEYSRYMEALLHDSNRTQRLDLVWRQWKKFEDNKFALLNGETTAYIDAVVADQKAKGKTWPTEKRVSLIKSAVLANVGKVREVTSSVLNTYMNLSKEDRDLLESVKDRNNTVKSFLIKVDKNIGSMNAFDQEFMLF